MTMKYHVVINSVATVGAVEFCAENLTDVYIILERFESSMICCKITALERKDCKAPSIPTKNRSERPSKVFPPEVC